jgi:hypothetical protein
MKPLIITIALTCGNIVGMPGRNIEVNRVKLKHPAPNPSRNIGSFGEL